MHKLIIHKLGPIEHCELECCQFMTLTGFQASGKSTIAKAIYYFRTIKDDILEHAKMQALKTTLIEGLDDWHTTIQGANLYENLMYSLGQKFIKTFGAPQGFSEELYLEYQYTDTCCVSISLTQKPTLFAPNCVHVFFNENLNKFLYKKNNCLSATPLGVPEEDLMKLKSELYHFFDDDCSVVYIPAGRSMITLLSQQFNYIYATMSATQKQSLDYCTKDYLERILWIESEFSEGLLGLTANYSAAKPSLSTELMEQALSFIKLILRGTYRYNNGEEQILLENEKYVKLNYSSSGQQECVWILNLLFYYLLQQNNTLFIIEEPESHLFPESQKYITELIALVGNCGHSIVLTTHSPYVLGTLNNLLYAHALPKKYTKKADKIIPASIWLNDKTFNSWFIKGGFVEICMDAELHMIQNERIDEISQVINKEFDELLDLQSADEEGGNP